MKRKPQHNGPALLGDIKQGQVQIECIAILIAAADDEDAGAYQVGCAADGAGWIAPDRS